MSMSTSTSWDHATRLCEWVSHAVVMSMSAVTSWDSVTIFLRGTFGVS